MRVREVQCEDDEKGGRILAWSGSVELGQALNWVWGSASLLMGQAQFALCKVKLKSPKMLLFNPNSNRRGSDPKARRGDFLLLSPCERVLRLSLQSLIQTSSTRKGIRVLKSLWKPPPSSPLMKLQDVAVVSKKWSDAGSSLSVAPSLHNRREGVGAANDWVDTMGLARWYDRSPEMLTVGLISSNLIQAQVNWETTTAGALQWQRGQPNILEVYIGVNGLVMLSINGITRIYDRWLGNTHVAAVDLLSREFVTLRHSCMPLLLTQRASSAEFPTLRHSCMPLLLSSGGFEDVTCNEDTNSCKASYWLVGKMLRSYSPTLLT